MSTRCAVVSTHRRHAPHTHPHNTPHAVIGSLPVHAHTRHAPRAHEAHGKKDLVSSSSPSCIHACTAPMSPEEQSTRGPTALRAPRQLCPRERHERYQAQVVGATSCPCCRQRSGSWVTLGAAWVMQVSPCGRESRVAAMRSVATLGVRYHCRGQGSPGAWHAPGSLDAPPCAPFRASRRRN